MHVGKFGSHVPFVLVRVTEIAESYGSGGKIREQITRFNNTQNTIKLSDFRSNDPVQSQSKGIFLTILMGWPNQQVLVPHLVPHHATASFHAHGFSEAKLLQDLSKLVRKAVGCVGWDCDREVQSNLQLRTRAQFRKNFRAEPVPYFGRDPWGQGLLSGRTPPGGSIGST